MKSKNLSRRDFIAKSAIGSAGLTLGLKHFASSKSKIVGPSDKIRVGFIGVGNRGTQLLELFMANEDVEIAALCDVYEPYITRDPSSVDKRFLESGRVPSMEIQFGKKVKRYTDFRKLLEQNDVDAVCIATPDHWHAVQTIMAMDSGKDVYVEKPLTITIKEGRAMVEAQKRTGRTAAVGLNRRGSSVFRKLTKEVRNNRLGKVTTARAWRISNMYPDGIGKLKPEAPPTDLDWDMWLGPRAFRPFQYNIVPYYFRWWKEYSSQMGNWGVHYMDVIRWMLGETAPAAVTAHGGKYIVNDDRDIPDTMEVFFEFDSGTIIQFSIHEANSGGGIPGGEVELNGTKADLVASQDGYHIYPASSGQFQTWDKLAEEEEYSLESDEQYGDLGIREDSTANLIRNFLDCIKSGDAPLCTLEDGHRSTSFAHLANISLEMGMRIEWDPEKERITNSVEANNLLHYEYRKPWKL